MTDQSSLHIKAVQIVRDLMAKTIRESGRDTHESDIKLNLSIIAAEAVTRIEELKG